MQTTRVWVNRLLIGVNAATLCVLLLIFVFHGANFSTPWDGPAVVTVVLAAATLVLATVTVGVALLAVWGYNSLRDYAKTTATIAANEAADEKVRKLIRDWGLDGIDPVNEDIAKSYTKEGGQ